MSFVLTVPASAQFITDEPAQIRGLDNDPDTAWSIYPVLTVGEDIDGYRPTGILDGIGIGRVNGRTNRIVVNSELTDSLGYAYPLANGTELRGARIHFFDTAARTGRIRRAGLAYDTVYDRFGVLVTDATQINEGTDPTAGFGKFCSGWSVLPGEHNFEDAIYFTGEETENGQLTALDSRRSTLHVVPMVGRAAFESIAGLDIGDPDLIAVLIGDDRGGAPLLLYVGQKDALGDGSFLDRNGLAMGSLYAWVSDDGDLSPEDWNGTGTTRSGTFVQVTQFDTSKAGQPGYDAAGYADMATLDALYNDAGAFAFARPEDLATNPADGTQVVFASTGRDSLFPSDTWGTTYLVDVDFSGMAENGSGITADLTVLYDGDDAGDGLFPGPDHGLRNPDNLDWADDGYAYIQEDRTTNLFGQTSGHEARVWRLDPLSGDLRDIAVVERGDANLPEDQTDGNPAVIGAWETSGILDVTRFFRAPEGVTVLVLNVQAHTVRDGRIAEFDLVQGGQLTFLLGTPRDGQLADVSLDGLGFYEALDVLSAARGVEPPAGFALGAQPNPFNWSSTLTYSVPEPAPVRIVVYDTLGREIVVLVDEPVGTGTHDVVFDGDALPSGVYLVRMTTPQGEQTQRVTLNK